MTAIVRHNHLLVIDHGTWIAVACEWCETRAEFADYDGERPTPAVRLDLFARRHADCVPPTLRGAA